ncbi:DUF4442 domain-containing protein [Legionella dresdenensis]|uniref:DUF4442 domain-containing protein n=1 Tax=Legionella dresdenensis TaxID=450200 RepID=A0ABV8CD31_9GAMM
MKLSARLLKWIFNLWPPFWGAGIKVITISPDFSYAKVSLAFRWYNKNYMRVQYGGSLYSMTDPFLFIMVLQRLGPGYVVWDKQGEIDYVRPGKSRVYAEFRLSEDQIEAIRLEVAEKQKIYPVFDITIYDEKQEVVAVVKKTLYVRLNSSKDNP